MEDTFLDKSLEYEETLNQEIDEILEPETITTEEINDEIDSILFPKPVVIIKKLIKKLK